jgi:hypothetical protein
VLVAIAIARHFSNKWPPLPPRAAKVVVPKTQHKLLLLDGANNFFRTYDIAIGRGGLQPKERQGDHRTPKGFTLLIVERKTADFIAHCLYRIQTTVTENEHRNWASIPAATL